MWFVSGVLNNGFCNVQPKSSFIREVQKQTSFFASRHYSAVQAKRDKTEKLNSMLMVNAEIEAGLSDLWGV